MALIVAVNTYATEEEANEYLAIRFGTELWVAADTVDKEAALSTATRLLDRKTYVGNAVSSIQELAWPRVNATYWDSRLGLDSDASGIIPKQIVRATCEIALNIINNPDVLSGTNNNFEKIKIGPIEITDSGTIMTPAAVPTVAEDMIKDLLLVRSSNMWWRAN